MLQIIANVSGSQYGGCTVDRVDEDYLVHMHDIMKNNIGISKQFVKESEIDRYVDQQVTKDINDAIESLEYEINTLYTSNGQTPFCNIRIQLKVQII